MDIPEWVVEFYQETDRLPSQWAFLEPLIVEARALCAGPGWIFSGECCADYAWEECVDEHRLITDLWRVAEAFGYARVVTKGNWNYLVIDCHD